MVRRYVFRYYRSGANHRTSSNFPAGKDHASRADENSFPIFTFLKKSFLSAPFFENLWIPFRISGSHPLFSNHGWCNTPGAFSYGRINDL
jgi:hypothetical protein